MMDTPTFHKWMRLFTSQIPQRGGKHMLFLDGHVSHISLATLQWAEAHNVVVFQLPSHASHRVQPLDVCAFGILKREYNRTLDAYQMQHQHAPTKGDVASLLGAAFLISMTPLNIMASFAGAGLFPYDPSRAIKRLAGEKLKVKYHTPSNRLPLLLLNAENTAEALGARKVRKLAQDGFSPSFIRAATVMCSDVLMPKQRVASRRARAGLVLGGLLSYEEMKQEQNQKDEAEAEKLAAKEAAKAAREEKRVRLEVEKAGRQAAKAAAREARNGGAGRGNGRGRGRGRG